jgi:hypothetical protein
MTLSSTPLRKIDYGLCVSLSLPPLSFPYTYAREIFTSLPNKLMTFDIQELSALTEQLTKLNSELQRKVQARNEYDKTIQETEAAYMKILESSQTLLHVLKRESINLSKKKTSSS